MQDGKHCPACGVDIGVWPIFSAGLPNLIRCPKCKARIGYQKLGVVLVVLSLLTIAVLAAAYVVAIPFEGKQRIITFIAVMLAAWVPIELAVAWYLRANKILTYRSGGAPPAERDVD